MPWKDLPRFEPSRESLLKLREKWKYGPCMDFRDDGLGYCVTCYWDHGSQGSELKRVMVSLAMEKMRSGESVDLFAEPVDVPAAIRWFLRWMEFRVA